MPPPWDPDEGETEETRILARPEDEPTRVEPPPPAAHTVVEEEPVETPAPGRGRELWPWLLLLLGLVAALLAALWWFSQDDDEPPAATLVSVPSVVRLEVNDAQRVLAEQGFRVEVLRQATDEAPEGIVFAQDPEAGTEVREGSIVRITASVGPASATVPDVLGMAQAEAVRALEDAGLRANPVQVPSERPEGTVVAQSPQAGAEVEGDSVVRLNVSGGPGPVAVPDVTGLPAADAVSRLEAAGLRAETGEVESDEPRGAVVAQEPVAGVEVERGSSVRLDVSAGPAPVAVPDVVGLPEDEATTQIEDLGFRVRVVEETAPDPAQVGTVLRQVPPAGREAPAGTQVTIVVGN